MQDELEKVVNRSVFLKEGLESMNRENYEEAQSMLQKSLEKEPELKKWAYFYLGLISHEEPETAIYFLRHAIEKGLTGEYKGYAHQNMGNNFLFMREYKDAIREYTRAELEGNQEVALQKGQAYFFLGDLETSDSCLKRASLTVKDNNLDSKASIHHFKGLIKISKGDDVNAITELLKSDSIRRFDENITLLSESYIMTGLVEEASYYLNKVLSAPVNNRYENMLKIRASISASLINPLIEVNLTDKDFRIYDGYASERQHPKVYSLWKKNNKR